jgi:hypothetical protein
MSGDRFVGERSDEAGDNTGREGAIQLVSSPSTSYALLRVLAPKDTLSRDRSECKDGQRHSSGSNLIGHTVS